MVDYPCHRQLTLKEHHWPPDCATAHPMSSYREQNKKKIGL
jgi:hypothetical protein